MTALGATLVACRDCPDMGLVRGSAYLVDSVSEVSMDLVDESGNWLSGVPTDHPDLALRLEIPGAPTAHVLVQPQPNGGITARIVVEMPGYSAASQSAALRTLADHLTRVSRRLASLG